MEITLEKIELVKDRTGVSYKEAKEALEATNGNVVDAIIELEEKYNAQGGGKISAKTTEIVSKIKETVKKGNVSKIVVKKNDEVVLNLPVNIGIVGAVIAPWGILAGTIAAFGTKCDIELLKDDGSIVDVSEIAAEKFDVVKEKGSELAAEAKMRGGEVFGDIKEKAEDVIDDIVEKAEGVVDKVKGVDLGDLDLDFVDECTSEDEECCGCKDCCDCGEEK